MILADLKIDGRTRKVILHAPKNGFFYVIDRTNGRFISAKNFADVNWATGYDKNGRPIETPEARFVDRPREIIPSPYGAHNWHPMSFNPKTGLVYLPVQSVPINLMDNKNWTMGGNTPGEPHGGLGWNLAMYANVEPPKSKPFGRLVAWDPVRQKEAWRQEQVSPWNGGTLTTAGNLVFQGTADGRFVAYDASSGAKLWETATGTGVVAGPVTYLVDGKQYVSVAVGWGGVYGIMHRATDRRGPGTVYTFAVGAGAVPPAFVAYQQGALLQGVKYDPAHVQEGTLLFVSNCVFCHGVPGVDRGGNIKNLGYSAPETIANLDKWVFNGPTTSVGMPDFTGKLTAEQVEKIKAFIQGTADAIRPKN
jgi:quinohemoprotein ethanol dehydrogenase